MWKRRRSRPERRSVADVIARTFELPVDVIEGLPEIGLSGNREAVVEHCLSVLEYNERCIRLNTGKLVLKFTGRDLQMKRMAGDSVTVEGFFTSIDFS